MIKQNTIPAVILSAFALTAIFAVTVQGDAIIKSKSNISNNRQAAAPTPTPASRLERKVIRAHSNSINNREAAPPKSVQPSETTIKKGHSNAITNREAAPSTPKPTPKK